MKFHANVMVFPGAILKNEVCVWGGWVIVSPPAGADAGMLMMLDVADCDCDWACDCDPPLEDGNNDEALC